MLFFFCRVLVKQRSLHFWRDFENFLEKLDCKSLPDLLLLLQELGHTRASFPSQESTRSFRVKRLKGLIRRTTVEEEEEDEQKEDDRDTSKKNSADELRKTSPSLT